MQLSLSEFARCMNMDPGIIARWIRQGRIPVKRKGDTCIFNRDALEKWAASHNIKLAMPGTEVAEAHREKNARPDLLSAIERGGVYYNVPGKTVTEALRAAVNRMEGIEASRLKDLLYEKLVDREQMMSTGIGGAVAVPHPRTPIEKEKIQTQIAVCFLEAPVDFQAVDKKPVRVLFILVASSAGEHLFLLSRISFCLRDDSFVSFLMAAPEKDAFFSAIAGIESRLNREGR